MGNTQGFPWNRPLKTTDASAMFHALDVHGNDRLNLKDLLAASDLGITLPHSLPALYFFDTAKDGSLTLPEFVDLVHFCHSEKRKVEEALTTDKTLRDLILRASRAGVKDCSIHGRSSFRRFSSHSNVRSVFSSREPSMHGGSTFSGTFPPSLPSMPPSNEASFRDGNVYSQPTTMSGTPIPESRETSLRGGTTYLSGAVPPSSGAIPPPYPTVLPSSQPDNRIVSRSPSESSDDAVSHITHSSPTEQPPHDGESASESPVTSDVDDTKPDASQMGQMTSRHSVAMYSSQREFNSFVAAVEDEPASSKDLKDPQNRTALDAAVLENIMHTNIHKLADLLHAEGAREKFMAWLWELADFNSSGVVSLDELRVFLQALSEDGIDLEEFVFYKEVGVPLEECIMNEFDTTHAGLLSRDEFMVLADLVTREYEFWENRHLERIGDYELGRTIGRGSSGVVRHAMHVETRKKVAIKIIKKGKCSDLSRLDREIQSLMAAKHRHIVALEEVLDSEANLFIVMELCGGGSLVDIVRLYPEERMPEETARFFMRQVFEALAFCHRNGICHRDIRLENLMLDNAGNVKITDFGHSGLFNQGWDLFSTSLVGSVYSLSPEQITGQLYSGEKIDIWSAGVAVYCLLVGRPPFFEPDVTPLLERITACDFEVPDFLSPKAKDLVHCMIRAVPEERITIQQMLHHPWFYAGPEFGPSMNTVVIPVDEFFMRRSDIAEMVMAITIYQHNLHFHLADTQNPHSSPEDQRGQEWTLKCLCPKNDIKFTVSLFSAEPTNPMKAMAPGIQAVASYSDLPELALMSDGQEPLLRRAGSTGVQQREQNAFGDQIVTPSSSLVVEQAQNVEAGRNNGARPRGVRGSSAFSGSKPPLHRRRVKVTPLNIAAHIRERRRDGKNEGDDFDFDSLRSSKEFYPGLPQEEAPPPDAGRDAIRFSRKERRGRHSRSHSLDGTGNLMRINRSATVDAFPYQKVYPQREMPDSARHLNFDKPDASPDLLPQSLGSSEEAPETLALDGSSSQLYRFHRSVTLHAVSSFAGEMVGRSPIVSSPRDSEIAQSLSRHPSKAVSPQLPQVRLSPHESVLENVEDLTLTATSRPSSEALREVAEKLHQHLSENTGAEGSSSQQQEQFQPFIEVRLQDGESGVFLKICRKLKNICTTKLAAAAERQKRKMEERREMSTMRQSASTKSIDSELTVEGGDNPARAHTFESRAESAHA